MMFGHELIESLHFIAPHRPCVQMDENLLFIGCGLAKGGDFFLFHVRQHKKLRPACPAKSFNAFPFSGFPLPKNAPYRFGMTDSTKSLIIFTTDSCSSKLARTNEDQRFAFRARRQSRPLTAFAITASRFE